MAAFVGLREPSAEDAQAGGGVVASGCARRNDARTAAAWAEGERLHEKVGEGPSPVTAAVSETVPVASTMVRPPIELI